MTAKVAAVKVAAIVAMDDARVIGFQGRLPWKLPQDMEHFRTLTINHVVIMGRKTWDSLPQRFKPLPQRTNIVVSRTPTTLNLPSGVLAAATPEEALSIARGVAGTTPGTIVWVIGGNEVYRSLMASCDEVHLTRVHGVHEGDATLPPFEGAFQLISANDGDRCVFEVWERKAGADVP